MKRPWTSLCRFWSSPTRPRTLARRRPARQRLCLESLEDRIVPTIVFEPFFGPETTYYGGGPVLGDTPVYLLYWGSYWNTQTGAAQETQFTAAIESELNSPIYNRVGANYGAGPVYIEGTWTATETPDPANGFSDAQLQNAVVAAINDLSDPVLSPNQIESYDGGNPPVYLVITPPGISSGKGSGVYGYHSDTFANLYDGNNQNVIYGWSGNSLDPNYSAQDFVTLVTSHELGEAITDPEVSTGPNGFYTSPGSSWPYGGGTGEIGDFEPEFEPPYDLSYSYRINGSLTQALWDYGDQAFTVSDGTVQNFYIDPQYTYNSQGGYYEYVGNELVIDGDQLGSNYNDYITIATNVYGGLIVELNGEEAVFDPGQITSLVVYTGGGVNGVNVLGTPVGMTTTIDGQGSNDTVTIGNFSGSQGNGYGSLGYIGGSVDVYGSGTVTLNVDDSGDTSGQTASMYDGQINYGGPASLYYTPTSSSSGGVVGLNVYGGSGANSFYVNSTSNFYNSTTINSGSGSNSIYVYATSSPLNLNDAGTDTVVIGAANTMTSINGVVDVYGSGATSLYLGDNTDTISRTVPMNDGSLTGLSPAAIDWTPTSSATGGVTALYVYGSDGGSTYNINNTSNLYNHTWLATGTANDTVNVYATKGSGTTGGLYVYNEGGSDSVDVGVGSEANINGFVTVYGAGTASTSLLVDDHLDSTARTATLTSTQLTGLGNAGTISYSTGVTSLTVDGSSKASTYNIQSTPAGVSVTVNGGVGNDIFNLGSGNSLNNIQGALTVNGGGGSNTLNANDSASASGQSYTLSKTTLGRSGIATITYASLHALSITGSGNDTLTLLNPVPTVTTTFNGGTGTNTLVGANVSNSWTITGANSGKLDSVTFSNVQNLVGGTGVDVFKFNSTSAKVASINGGGAPAGQGDWLNYSSLPSSSTVTVNLATGSATNVNGGAAGAVTNIQNVIGSATGTNNLTGSSQGNILIGGSGNNTLTGGSGNSLLIGGSGHGTITGGSGTDILIAGTTTYNATTTAGEDSLMAILAELQSADTFAQKVSDLINGSNSGGGSDLNGKNKLTWGGASPTVKPSTGAFTLSGDTGASSSPDWFFSASSSTVTDFNDDGVNDEHNNNAIGIF